MNSNIVETIKNRFKSLNDKNAIYWERKIYSYKELYFMINAWNNKLNELNIKAGTVCAVMGEFSPKTCSLFFSLMEKKCIIVPFTKAIKNEIHAFKKIACVEVMFTFDSFDNYTFESFNCESTNVLINSQKEKKRSGLIVFSSGSTGKPKGIFQDCENVLKKFLKPRIGWKTVLFLMMDHFGGFNTFLAALSYGGMAVCLKNRTPEDVCIAIQESKAELLPTTPTFLNLLIASRCYRSYDLKSIKIITYGTEMMSDVTLSKIKEIFPNANIKQTYGLSELGVLRSKSESNESLWVKIGGEEFQTKIIDNILWIKSEANMIGYLNAPNPFDENGWFCTGDAVQVKGEYVRFLGRKTEIINVGGQKVFPIEVENVILEDENIKEVVVVGKKHPLMGQVVIARVSLYQAEALLDLSIRLRKLCISKLAKFKVPVKFEIITEEQQHNARFKKIRL